MRRYLSQDISAHSSFLALHLVRLFDLFLLVTFFKLWAGDFLLDIYLLCDYLLNVVYLRLDFHVKDFDLLKPISYLGLRDCNWWLIYGLAELALDVLLGEFIITGCFNWLARLCLIRIFLPFYSWLSLILSLFFTWLSPLNYLSFAQIFTLQLL